MGAGRGNAGRFARGRLPASFRSEKAVFALVVLLGLIAFLPGWAGTEWPLGLESVPCFVVGYLYLRHIGLAALTALAALPATVGQFAVPSTPDTAALFALSYGLAFSIALFVADGISLRIAEGSAPAAAATGTLRGMAAQIFFCIVAGVAILTILSSMSKGGAFRAAAFAECVGCVSGALGVALGASLLSFDEDFVARTNRIRERRERWSFYLVQVAGPGFRWGVVGIAVLWLVLGVYGVASSHATWSDDAWASLSVSVLVCFAVCLAAFRDWRPAFATTLSLLPAAVSGIWALEHAATSPAFPVVGAIAETQVVGMAIVLLSINSTDLFISPLAVVLECGIERKAALAIYACVATTLALLPLYALNDTLVLPLVVAILGAGTGAILFQPAFAAAVESLTQRREVTGTRYQTS